MEKTYTYHFHAICDDGIRVRHADELFETQEPICGWQYEALRKFIAKEFNSVPENVSIVSLVFLHSTP